MPEHSEFDDYGLLWTLQMQLQEITTVCTDLSLPGQGNIAIGATPLGGINARQMGAFGDASLIEVTITLMRLCDLIAKVMSNTIDHKTVDGKPSWVANRADVQKRLETDPSVLNEWKRVIKLFAIHSRPPHGVPGPEPRGAEAKNTRVLMSESMELWVVAHEVCHHALRHGTNESTANNSNPFDQEFQADILGRYILASIARRRDTPENDFLVAGIGAALALGAMHLVERAQAVLDTGSDSVAPSNDHPPISERLAAIQKSDAEALPQFATPWGMKRQVFVDILDMVWNMVRPDFEEMRRRGITSARA
jgi:hypothetical protein